MFLKRLKNSERIIVGAYGEDMVSLQKILILAKKYDRKVVTYGKNYADLLEITKKFVYLMIHAKDLNYLK